MKRFFVVGALLGWALAHGSQNTVCKEFITCFEATGGTKGALDSTFGASGSCWTSAQRSDECFTECIDKRNALIAEHPDAGCGMPTPRGC